MPDRRAETSPAGRWSVGLAVAAGLTLVAVSVADALITDRAVVLTIFLGLAPLLAAAVLRPLPVLGFAAAALGLAVLAGAWNPDQGAQYGVRLVNVALLGGVAVLVSALRTRRETELVETRRIATAAQEALLPVIPRRVGTVEVATRYNSATREAQIGGDFFDFVADLGRTRFILGDVSGKGVDAVGQAARVIRAFRQYGASETDLLDVARRIDEYVRPFWVGSEYFATAVLVEIVDDRTFTLVSAGHPPPLHVSRDGVVELPVASCPPLGLGPAHRSTCHTWQPSDSVLLYTDGLIEARDADGEFLPASVIESALREPGVDSRLDRLLQEVDRHAGGFKDDLAMLLMTNRADTTDASQQAR